MIKIRLTSEVVTGIVGGASIVVGFVGGYLLANKKLEDKYAEISDAEIEKAKQFYSVLRKEGKEYASPEAVIAEKGYEPALVDAAEALNTYRVNPTEFVADLVDEVEAAVETTVEKEISRNIFTDAQVGLDDVDFDYDAELAKRTPDEPYVISVDEFIEINPEYDRVTVTYYEQDDTLVDDQGVPIPNIDDMVGETNLENFGYGSRDPKIVYVRNENRALQFEVIRHDGSYSEEIFGVIRHSDRRPLRKFRKDADG